MSQDQKTLKTPGYRRTRFPEEVPDTDLTFQRKLIINVMLRLLAEQKTILRKHGWTAAPTIHQNQIFQEYRATATRLRDIDRTHGFTGKTKCWPDYAIMHNHNWVERRVNYLATEKYGFKVNGVGIFVNTGKGRYQLNPKLSNLVRENPLFLQRYIESS